MRKTIIALSIAPIALIAGTALANDSGTKTERRDRTEQSRSHDERAEHAGRKSSRHDDANRGSRSDRSVDRDGDNDSDDSRSTRRSGKRS